MNDFLDKLQDAGLNVKVASDAAQVAGWVDTGNYALNYAISGRFNRGWPLGHMAEIFGAEGTGKSFLVARAVAEMQKAGGLVLLDDTEGAFNPKWARQQLGVNVENLIYTRSGTVKEHHDFVDAVIEAFDTEEDAALLLALDSLALLSTDHEMKVKLDKPSMTKAKEVRAHLRILGKALHDRKIVYLMTNHTIANIGSSPWESNTTTPGGGGPKFESSIRVSMRTPKKIKAGDEQVGVIVRAVIEKNRLCPPYREAEIAIPFDRAIERTSGLIPVLVSLGIVKISGRTLTYERKDTGIKAWKSKKLKQDKSSALLLDTFPDIIEKADAELAEREKKKFGAADFDDAEVEDE